MCVSRYNSRILPLGGKQLLLCSNSRRRGFFVGFYRLGVFVGSNELHQLNTGNEHVHREEAVVFGDDDQRVA